MESRRVSLLVTEVSGKAAPSRSQFESFYIEYSVDRVVILDLASSFETHETV